MDDTVDGYADDTVALEERDTVASTETATTQSAAPDHNNSATVQTTTETASDAPAHPEIQTDLPRLQESGRLGNGLVSPPLATLRRFDCPACIITGEHVMEQTDYHLSAPLPLMWTRTYRSVQNSDVGLGFGWSAP